MSSAAIGAAQVRQAAQIEAAQQAVLGSLASAQAQVIYRTKSAFNGIAIAVDAAQLPAIAKLAGVKAIHPLVTYNRDNASSVPLIGAPGLWDGAGANVTGTGLTIGVIDSGIDYTHVDFGGTGNFAGNDGTVIEQGSFPTTKVVGGYDLAGDTYNADPDSTTYNPIPTPDPDPLDCAETKGGGHGTHVSGTIAGYGVTSAGATYAGPWNNTTDFNSLKIGPGVAPGASLYALRVFGCDGSTDLVAQALDYAVDPNQDGNTSDHLDVINMSLGSSFGGTDDASSQASANAVAVGVIVVASAGNSGDTTFITGSPATTDGVISVASSLDSTSIIGGFVVNAPAGIAGVKPGTEASFGPDLADGALTGDLVAAVPATACTAITNDVSGKIALIDRGTCAFQAKVVSAQNAGAIGVIIANNVVGDPITMGTDGSGITVTIPSMMTTQGVGSELRTALGTGTVNVTLTAQYRDQVKSVAPEYIDTLSSFSSRGPRRDGILKPDITAPGDTIFSAQSGSNTEGVSYSGTSMAAPHVAGAMALLKQIHPTWSVQELKALAMNTATSNLRTATAPNSTQFAPARIGAGRITLANAAVQNVLLYDTARPSNVSLSFGNLEITQTVALQRPVTVVNKGGSAATFDVAYSESTPVTGVVYSVSPASVTLAAGASTTVTVTMSIDATTLARHRDAATATTQNGLPRQYLTEASGYVTMTPGNAPAVSGPVLRLPVYAIVQPASQAVSADAKLKVALPNLAETTTLTLSGSGSPSNNFPALVSALELQSFSDVNAGALPEEAGADLRYIGAMSDFASTVSSSTPTGVITDTFIYFGLATYGERETPTLAEFDIYIDADRDGTSDAVLFNWNDSSASGGTSPSDVFVSVLCPLNASGNCSELILEDYLNGLSATAADTGVFNTDVMVLPVAAEDLGIEAGQPFDYFVASFSNETGNLVDVSDTLRFNPSKPGVDTSAGFAGPPLYDDGTGNTILVDYNPTNYFQNNSKGILLLHHHNVSGTKAEVVNGPSSQIMPFIMDQ